jgi:hypothetical protein
MLPTLKSFSQAVLQSRMRTKTKDDNNGCPRQRDDRRFWEAVNLHMTAASPLVLPPNRQHHDISKVPDVCVFICSSLSVPA